MKNFEKRMQREYQIAESNKIAQQKFTTRKSRGTALSLAEERLLCYVISRLKFTDTELEPVPFDISAMCEVCGLNVREHYTAIKDTADGLLRKSIWITRPDGTEEGYSLLSRVTLSRGSGRGTIELNPALRPYFIQLAGNYHTFRLHDILAMRSVYGIRLYKLLRSFMFKTLEPAFTLEELQGYMDALGKYPDIRNLKRRLIEPALKDINSYTPLRVMVEYTKEGRKITGVKFKIEDLAQLDPVEMDHRHRAAAAVIDGQIAFEEFLNEISNFP